MRFAEKDWQKDTPRPLARCGAYVAPGQDARWRKVSAKTKRIDSVTARNKQRAAR